MLSHTHEAPTHIACQGRNLIDAGKSNIPVTSSCLAFHDKNEFEAFVYFNLSLFSAINEADIIICLVKFVHKINF